MTETLIMMLALGAAVLFWSAAREAAERARAIARQACRQAQVQLLDETVSLERLGMRRAHDGRVRLLRQYRYEYSRDGQDRLPGGLALLGRELLWLQGPVAPKGGQDRGQDRMQG